MNDVHRTETARAGTDTPTPGSGDAPAIEPAIEPEMRLLIQRRADTATVSPSPVERRQAWNDYSRTLAGERPADLQVRDDVIEHAGLAVPVRTYHPAGGHQAPLPCAVYFHGGGFVLGDLDSSDFVAWGLAVHAGCAVVSVDYPLSPEHPFPAAFDAAYACVDWIASQGRRLGVDGSRLVLAGDSAGGNLAAAVCLAARDRGGPPILGQALAYPWLSPDLEHGSRLAFAEGFGLTTAGLGAYLRDYRGGDVARRDPYAFPLDGERLDRLPPAWIQVASQDPVRDDGRAYAKRLIEHGVQTCYREAPRSVHAFLRAWRLGPAAAREMAAFGGFVGTCLRATA